MDKLSHITVWVQNMTRHKPLQLLCYNNRKCQDYVNVKGECQSIMYKIKHHLRYENWGKWKQSIITLYISTVNYAIKPNITYFTIRWDSMQSVKNKAPLPLGTDFPLLIHHMANFKPFLSCVLPKFPITPKFDTYPWVKIAPKLGKTTEHDQNVLHSENGKDTSEGQISDHYFYALLRKWP